MAEYEYIEYGVGDGIARVRLNRPDSLNAFTREMGLELGDAVERSAADEAARVVVLDGAGRAFSSGADVKGERPRNPEGELDLASGLVQVYGPTILTLRGMPKPVVAAVNGVAAGFGVALACACDLLVAAESAYFMLAFVRMGLIPDGGASLTIPARIGLGRATQLAMLGDRLSAAEAREWGLVNAVHPDDAFAGEVDALAARLAAGPVGSYAEMKALFNRRLLPELEAALGAEAGAQFRRGTSPEYHEGVAAFREKRAPDFAAARERT